EFISAALGNEKVFRTRGNFNSTIGLPLSIMEIPQDAEMAVLEMGMSARGEIEEMSKAARPDLAVITNIGSSHLEMLGSRENILAAKLEIVSGMSDDGILLINGDDPMLCSAKVKQKTLKVGFCENCDFRAEIISENGGETEFAVNGVKIKIPTYGKHNVYAAAFGFAAAKLLGVPEIDAIRGLSAFEKPKMRQNIYEYGGVTVIEDCYNASPESMRAALDVAKILASEKSARIVALLGDMLELGENTEKLHFEIGEYARKSGAQKLITLGALAEKIADGAALPETVQIKDRDHERAAEALINTLKEGDILLVKASRGVAAEKVLEIYKERRK
ncbi:MAG: UDP-N-acetylmuramoyl-tripeptide--D-alanyl-D-alanine ligase, partial [Clostridia bacterium]|nr:UDP-N-acetylmuramoyl-tripeptide--D-alanyl-D-alanine ligase [Clostridia bacterium]